MLLLVLPKSESVLPLVRRPVDTTPCCERLFSAFSELPPRQQLAFSADPVRAPLLERVSRGIMRGTVVIPPAGFSVSSVPLTCMVTIAHAIREGARTGRTNKAQANGLGLEVSLNPKRRAM